MSYEPGVMYYHEKEFVAYVRGIIDSEKQRMEYESNRIDNLARVIGKKESKLPTFENPPSPPKPQLHGPLKLIEEALNKLGK